MRLRVIMLTATTVIGSTGIACAGPCTAQIAEVERNIGHVAPGPDAGPTGPQSIGAQLHHQPTPGSVESAESKASSAAEAALDRARTADAAGDAGACKRAIEDAKELYGLE